MKRLIIFITFLALYSCAKEEFKSPGKLNSFTPESQKSYSDQSCAKSTYVRPPVDLLFLWDNSTSSIYLNDQTKQALNNVISYVSDRFDYNVMMAPLLGTGNNEAVFFSRPCETNAVASPTERGCTSPGNGVQLINKSSAANMIDSFSKYAGSAENGVSRAVSLLAANRNTIFRQNAYTIVITMSNDDDNSWIDPSSSYQFNPYRRDLYVKGKAHDLLCLRGNYDSSIGLHNSTFSQYNSSCSNAPSLNSTMLRYISISALFEQNQCQVSSNLTPNYVYKNVSKRIYETPYTNGFVFPAAFSNNPEEVSDAFNICRGNFANIFDGVNNAITDAIIAHVYKYWPIAPAGQDIDPSSLDIQMSNGTHLNEIPSSVSIVRDPNGKNDTDNYGNPVSGYRLMTGSNYVNTRFLPTDGEPFSGQVVELFGNAKVTYPGCLLVNYSEPEKYFGYIHLADRPDESTIEVRINGATIPKSATNGWQLMKSGGSPQYQSNFNIRITSPSDFTPLTPAENRTGYFLQLAPSVVYSNNANVQVAYQTSAN